VIQRELPSDGIDLQREAERVLLQKFAPPGVLVTADGEILQFRGDTGLFLTPAPGRATLDLLKMLREGLLVGVRGALHRAIKEETAIREENLRVKSNGGYRDVDIEVLPVKGGGSLRDGYFLVLFHEHSGAPPAQASAAVTRGGSTAPPATSTEADERQIARLTQELAATREYLQSVIEQQEAANEELQSANEEVQSANEELQSINEELETSKEEIESSNEELATVNDELQNRNLELSQSNNDLMNLLSSVQMPIVMLGPKLLIRRFTPMAERMLNLIPADVGRPISDIKLNIDVADLEKLLLEVIDTVTVHELEVRDRHGRWFLLRIQPYKTVENKIDGAVMVLVDVDSLKRSEETARRQAELLSQTHEPIIMWQYDDSQITYWNRGAQAAYGYTSEEAIGKIVHDLLRTSPAAQTFRESLKDNGRWVGDLTHTRKDGQQILIESLMVLLRDDAGRTLVIETNRDVTQRASMERTLRERADQLAHADRSKDEFLAMLAHELRNPLAPLRNAVELMKVAQSDPAAARYTREVIERQVGRMARLVDDLLNVSRITQGKLELQKRAVRANAVISAAVETAQPSFDSRGQTLDVNLLAQDLWLNADPLRLEQVFVNLLDNASKYTANGGHIRLTAEPARSSDVGGLIVRVRDDGIGITTEMQPHVFELFMQSSRTLDRSQGGLGIGLTLVKRLVEMHEGSVQVHSEGAGRGSEFIVELPVVKAAPPDVPAISLPASTTAPVDGTRRVLVVDDNVDAAESMAMLLSLSGHETKVAHDGSAALDAADEFGPEVVMLDIGLPGLDGFEVARRLRERFDGIRLIALSGYGQSEFRDKAAVAGFDRYLTKPVDAGALHAAVMAR
jgi:two-component system CheB/CheR fusion protein